MQGDNDTNNTTGQMMAFDFQDNPVRCITQGGEPWFVVADVCRVLSLANPSVVIQKLDDDERAKFNLGRQGETNVINESGLYTLILRCDDAIKPGTVAHSFRKWVTSEVIPQIRQTGSYKATMTGAGVGDDLVSLLRFVREACHGWSLERQMEFGLTARRYAKSMGVVFQTKVELGVGKVFAFPRAILEQVRKGYQSSAALPDSDAAEFEKMLEALHNQYGEEALSAEVVRGFAKLMGLFPAIFGKDTSLESERSGFGKLCVRFDHIPFPSGFVLKLTGRNRSRRLRVERRESYSLMGMRS